MNVNYSGVPGPLMAIAVWLIVLTLVLRRQGRLRPHDPPILS